MVEVSDSGSICLKLIDFGLIQQFKKAGIHITEKKNNGVRGTKIYMSYRAHMGWSLSRRDDWESLCYVIYSLVAPLPWAGESDEVMIEMKQDFVKN